MSCGFFVCYLRFAPFPNWFDAAAGTADWDGGTSAELAQLVVAKPFAKTAEFTVCACVLSNPLSCNLRQIRAKVVGMRVSGGYAEGLRDWCPIRQMAPREFLQSAIYRCGNNSVVKHFPAPARRARTYIGVTRMKRVRTTCSLVVCCALFAGLAIADTPIRRPDAFNPDDRTIDVFEGMEAGEIEVKFIPKDEKEAVLLVENKTDKPMNVKMPEAFAGVPVLAQIGGGLGGGGLGGGLGGGGQGVGGGLGGGGLGGGLGGGGLGGGGGVFNVAPGKIGKLKVTSVCLEHGKPDPNARMTYTIKPISELTDKPEVVEVCKMLVRGEIDQASAQAAAWHLQDGLTWQQLAAKEKVHLSNGYVEMYFNRNNIALAMKATSVAGTRAKSATPQTSPGQQGAE